MMRVILALTLRRVGNAFQQTLQHAPLTRQQVRQALANPAVGTHNSETLAAVLNLSPRSLHRQLREEVASLQQLKDEVRSGTARALLLRTSKPIKQVAAAAGFRIEKSFIRAFREWTGVSPGEFRRGVQA